MEKHKLLELDIDVNKLIDSVSRVKKRLDELNTVQAELKKRGDTSSAQFIKNASDLKALEKEYKKGVSVITQFTQKTAEMEAREKILTGIFDTQVTSIEEARNQNKFLNKVRNEVNVTTKEGAELLAQLNAKLDQNNEFIKENADAYTRQKINIGNYKDGMKEAFNEINIFNGGLTGFIQRSKDAGGVGKLVKGSLKGMAQGFIGVTKASLAFIATPVGAVLALLVGAFALVKNAMNRSEEATNKITRIFKTFSGITNRVLKALEPLGEFLIDSLVVGFDLAGKAADKAMGFISKGLKFLGFEEASKSVNDFTEEVKESAKEAQKLADAEAKLDKMQRKAQQTQLDYQKSAEKLRQIRDNENLSINERAKANEQLGKVLKNQLKDELAIAKQALKVANLKIEAEGKTTELLNQQQEALNTVADIEERITGQESEQLTNRVALQKEATQKTIESKRKILDEAIKESKTLLAIFVAEQGVKAKTLQEEIDLAEKVKKKKIDILKAELKAKKITQSEYNLAVLELDNDLIKKRAELAVDNAERELQAFKDNHKSKLDANTFLSEELLNQETARLDAIAEKERKYHKKRLEEGVINQQQYNDAINAVNEENRITQEELKAERKLAEQEQKEIDFVNDQELKYLNIQNDFDREFQVKQDNLNKQRKQEVEAAKKNGADVKKINDKYDKLDLQLEREKANAKMAIAGQTFGALADLIGRESTAGKALSVAQATINTYLGATKALATFPPPFGAIQAGVTIATGLAQVAKITGIGIEKPQKPNLPKAEKGAVFNIGGKRHSEGGTKFYGEDGTAFEAEKGESMFILNRRASAALAPLLSDINQQYGGTSLFHDKTYLSTGGRVLQGAPQQSNNTSKIDTNGIREAVYQGAREGTSDANINITENAIE